MSKNKKILLGEDPAECGRYISYLYRKSGTYFTSEFKKIGLSSAQSIVLIGIYRYEGINQQALAETISMMPGVASRVLRELEDKDYVKKVRNEENRRNYNLYLTPKGLEITEYSLTLQGKYWNRLLQGISPEEIIVLNTLLQKMERQALDFQEAECQADLVRT